MRLLSAMLLASAVGFGAVVADVADVAQRYGAVPLVPGGLMPRFFIDRSTPILKRDGSCGDDNHPCRDIGFASQCCSNDDYCYVNESGDAKCCPIGSNCSSDSLCSSEDYFCTRTITPTARTGTTTPTATTQEGCCGRSCPETSQYLCAADVGGQCCGFGYECRSGGNCISTEAPSKTPLLTPIPEGCTTSQFQCEDEDGCCDNGQRCTQVSGTGYCAPGTPTGSGVTIVDEDDMKSNGLSDGAKAGIAVGVIVGSGIIIGLAAWIFITKRRRRRQTETQHSSSGEGDGDRVNINDPAMTEITASSRPPVRGRGLTNDYFGPDAVPGPYTETLTEASSPGRGRAVPSQPQAPGDIAAPVEIDSQSPTGPLTPSSLGVYETPASQTIDGRFELYGTEMEHPTAPSPSVMLSPSGLPSPSTLPSPQSPSPRHEEPHPNRF